MSTEFRAPPAPPAMPPQRESDAREPADRLPIGRFLVWFVGGLAVVLSLAALADGDAGGRAADAATSANASTDRAP